MNRKALPFLLGAGCLLLILLAAIPITLVVLFLTPTVRETAPAPTPLVVERPHANLREEPLLDQPVGIDVAQLTQTLSDLYQAVNPGVVTIDVQVTSRAGSGAGAGSGFIISEEGYIATNHHVVAGANLLVVTFFNGIQSPAEVVGSDPDSDLAIIKVDQLPEETHPLPLGDSDIVLPGEFVIAIGNPFSLGSSMTLGIVSAVGRVIPSGFTQFNIPQAIQTDAAINPGNSGGPLVNLSGEVIGINAQIRTAGERASAGVGFAIPANILQLITPSLIQEGAYSWPWLGVTGLPVSQIVMEANNLPAQQGAYIDTVVPNGPADKSGLQGSQGEENVGGLPVPVGGDVVVEIDGLPVADFNGLLSIIAFKRPGDQVLLGILRNGERVDMPVTLEARPRGTIP